MNFGAMKLIIFAWILTVLQKTSGAPINSIDDEAGQRAWLSQFGYTSPAASSMSGVSQDSGNMFAEAVKSMQRFVGLPETGVVDAETKGYMKKSRCGMTDYPNETSNNRTAKREKRYVVEGSSWDAGSTLKYRINRYISSLPQIRQDQIFETAFYNWASVANIRFQRVVDTSIPVDIDIKFARGNHGDPYPFDGPGKVLAHAFFPSSGGDEHYDEDENWTHRTTQGTNLFQTAVHEIGHTLGLSHSQDRAAVMWPYAGAYDPNFVLGQDDIRGIQAIYGARSLNTERPPVPTQAPTETPTETPTGPNGALRLSGDRSSASQGRVEIYHNNQWNTICDDFWDDNDATVVCRQLGYSYGQARQAAHFGRGSGKIAMDDVNCTGAETRLMNCPFPGWNQQNCDHSEDAGVICSNSNIGGSLRLVGGGTSNQGRLEIYYNNRWNTICDDAWDNLDAAVACRQLGYRYGFAKQNGYFGSGTGDIGMDEINCTGSEHRFRECGFNGWYKHDCNHNEDAGVVCSNNLITGTLRLVGGGSSHQGRVEVYYQSKWSTICDDDWDDVDATVACTQLGYEFGIAKHGGYFGNGTGVIAMDDVGCTGAETWLADCPFSGWNRHNCDHNEDAAVLCSNSIFDGMLRLVGGGSSHQGRVEIYYDNQWNTICDDNWDHTDATVACRQLGYRSGEAKLNGKYGAGSGGIAMDEVQCTGTENRLMDCTFNGWNKHDCNHSEDAGIVCYMKFCESSPCQNGGTCTDNQYQYKCNCQPGFTGDNCQTAK